MGTLHVNDTVVIACVHAAIHTNTHTHMHARTHTHTRTHTRTHTQVGDRSVWEHDAGREMNINLYDKFSAKHFDG